MRIFHLGEHVISPLPSAPALQAGEWASAVVERGPAILRVHPIIRDVVSSLTALDWIPPPISNRKFDLSVFRIDVLALLVIAGSIQGENPAPLVHFPFAFSSASRASRSALSRSR